MPIDFTSPKIMGILNVTPDSFFDGGTYDSEYALQKRIETMVADGVDIIDIGACSSRPGAEMVSAEEENRRLWPALRIMKRNFPHITISIDTFRTSVVRNVLDTFGEVIVNDISGGEFDKKMMPFCGENSLTYICMHMKGEPATMQTCPHYEDVVGEVLLFFKEKIKQAKQASIPHLILDPGFGFGKTDDHNFLLMRHLEDFAALGFPVLVGVSRKSMIQRALDCSADNALNGTTILNTIALSKGASILRVHDVKEAKEVVTIFERL